MTVHIGESIARREDIRLLSGAGRYVDDVHLDGMIHAALFRSAWPHGRIRSINVTAAAAVPGVVGVFTHSDFGPSLKPIRSRIASMPGFENFLQLPLATDKVRYVGEPIAVVVAASPYVAEDAASLISAEIDGLPPVLNWEAANDRSVLIHEAACW
jgi:carbon-monoxide dehydrogenase large subunit